MTLVFGTPVGSLIQVQIGPSDVVSTISAAYSTVGWLGGLDSVRFMLSKTIGNKARNRGFEDLVEHQPRLHDSTFHIITSIHGPLLCSLPTASDAFGGDRSTQAIGMTICALAHELGGPRAVDLFMQFVVPTIFDGTEMIHALHGKLREEDVLHRLLNEGVTRGLPELFLKSVMETGLPEVNSEYYTTADLDDDTSSAHSELGMVAGLLRWTAPKNRNTDPYLTRSGLVARIAGYLKVVGYNIGPIQLWDGFPPIPRASGPWAVLLVLGGSQETDHLMTEPLDALDSSLQLHYTFHTVGSVLHQSLAPDVIIPPETLQMDFEYIFEFIASQLRVSYEAISPCQIPDAVEATFFWSNPQRKSSSIEIALASVHFQSIAGQIAPCYRGIASQRTLDRVRESRKRRTDDGVMTAEEGQFRATTVAIIICLVSRLSSTDFKSVRHSLSTDLLSRFSLSQIGEIINRGYPSSLNLNEAVGLLAMVHTGIMYVDKTLRRIESPDRIIGWRNGMYCVLPSLLLNMKPLGSSVTLACKDVFYANVRTHHDGSIRDLETPGCWPDLSYLHSNPNTASQQAVVEGLRSTRPWIGPAHMSPPSEPLYLNVERPFQSRDSDICLAGRLHGTIIGNVSVVNVLASIARSVEASVRCSHNDTTNALNVLNVSTSAWLDHRNARPAGSPEVPAYLAVCDDPAWALFAAGECATFHHSIVYECLNCAREAVVSRVNVSRQEAVVLIGYCHN